MTADEILERLLALPEDRCAKVIETALERLEESRAEATGIGPSWAKEINRRLAEIDSGEAAMIPGDQALKMIGKRFRDATSSS